MALIFNSRPEIVNVQVCGNWFEFKPEQVKLIHNENIAHLMVTDKSFEGLVSVPDSVLEDPHSEDTKRIKVEAKKKGIANRINFLEKVKYNLLVSLQRDINKAGLKYDALLEATEGEKKALKELAMYRDLESKEKDSHLAELQALKEKLGGDAIKSDT